MKGLKYQLKNIQKDKMCILTFLLPIMIGIAIHLLSGVSFQTMSETSFGILKNDLSKEATAWLQLNGNVVWYETLSELKEAVNNPSTQMIGVLKKDNGIRTFLSGDELQVNKVIADTLPKIYDSGIKEFEYDKTILSVSNEREGLKSLLIVMTLVTAMFMGCTFNAMNIISEKEDGVALINKILPMTAQSYIIQKILLGLIGSIISVVITAFICIQIDFSQILPFIFIIILSSYISALIGLFIGYFSEGLMIGIVYIKVIMILFLAPPIFFYLTVPNTSIIFKLSYFLPSSATFYGLMDLLNGHKNTIWLVSFILFLHAILGSISYIFIRRRGK